MINEFDRLGTGLRKLIENLEKFPINVIHSKLNNLYELWDIVSQANTEEVEVIIEVLGGVATVKSCPESVKVRVIDQNDTGADFSGSSYSII